MKKNLTTKLLLSIIFLTFVVGCATAPGMKEASTIPDVPVITDMQVQDNTLLIRSNKSFTYTIYSSGDPYKMTIEIADMTLGAIKDKMVFDKGGITEAVPVQINSPKPSVKIDVTMQTPATVVPSYGDNTLSLTVKAEEPVVLAEVKNAPAPSESAPAPAEAAKPEAAEVPAPKPAEEKAAEMPKAPEAAAPVLPKATAITGIEVRKSDDAVKVMITGDGSIMSNVFPVDGRIVVDIPGVTLKTALPKGAVPPLKALRVGKHKDKVRLVLDLKEKTNYEVTAVGNSIEIALQKKEIAKAEVAEKEPVVQAKAKAKESPKAKPEDKEVVAKAPEKEISVSKTPEKDMAAAGSSAPSATPTITSSDTEKWGQHGKFTGRKINLDFQDADIIPIFRLLADISGYNIVVHPDIKGRINLKLMDVPWDQALDLIMRTFQLAKLVDGNIIRIVPANVVAREIDDFIKTKKAESEAGELVTRIYPVNYAALDKLQDAIDKAKILSSRGTISRDERGSSLIVNDLAANVERLGALIKEIDQENMQARQVMIEAKIVEINTDYTKELGIQWGLNFIKPRISDTLTIGSVSGGLGNTGITGNNLLVNLPAAVGFGSGGAIGFGYVNRALNYALDLQLSAMESFGKGKILSNPRIMTMNNEQAKITQGRNLQIPIATSDKTDLKEVPILLSLDVKPRIAPGGAILMHLKITKDELLRLIASGTSTGADVAKNTVDTTVLVNNGDTIVIGGIYKQTNRGTEDGVPGLNKIPLLGRLFKKEFNTETTSEILIFISPKIVEFSALK
ncbi:MAG: type IV pilus secretin PilQ [Nitrospirae bacterium]|nr:type IV pilus secretin PilQ [Nitrospirota bacterium]